MFNLTLSVKEKSQGVCEVYDKIDAEGTISEAMTAAKALTKDVVAIVKTLPRELRGSCLELILDEFMKLK